MYHLHSITDNIYSVIKNVVKREESELKTLCNKSIFSMPEIALAYEIGKQIYINRELIFGCKDVEWMREISHNNECGPSDLSFEIELETGNFIYWTIEFKVAGKKQDYLADIQKLKKLPKNHEGLFCAVMDSWPDKPDVRAELFRDKKLVDKIYRETLKFETTSHKYQNQILTVVGFGRAKRMDLDNSYFIPTLGPNATEEDIEDYNQRRYVVDEYIQGDMDDLSSENFTLIEPDELNDPL